MSYTKTQWVNGQTVIDADLMNKIESGIEEVTNTADDNSRQIITLNEHVQTVDDIARQANISAAQSVQDIADLKTNIEEKHTKVDASLNNINTNIEHLKTQVVLANNKLVNIDKSLVEIKASYYPEETDVPTKPATGNVTYNVTEEVSGTETTKATPTFKSTGNVIVNNLVSTDATVTVSGKNATVSGISSSGDLGKYNSSGVGLSMDASESVKIYDADLQVKCYNGINIAPQANSPRPKSIVIDNLHIGTNTNNAINIYSFAKDAEITISNCTFDDISNSIRFGNVDNVPATVNIINCHTNKWTDGEYAGLLCLQDHSVKTIEEAYERKCFAKMTFNIINCTYGEDKKQLKDMCADKQAVVDCVANKDYANQIAYIFYAGKNGSLVSEISEYPTFNIQ